MRVNGLSPAIWHCDIYCPLADNVKHARAADTGRYQRADSPSSLQLIYAQVELIERSTKLEENRSITFAH